MHELFISYCRHDLGAANALADTFSKAGLSVWMDRKGVQEGAAFDTQIEEAIAQTRVALRGGATAVWPLATHAQQGERMRRIDVQRM